MIFSLTLSTAVSRPAAAPATVPSAVARNGFIPLTIATAVAAPPSGKLPSTVRSGRSSKRKEI